MHVPIQVNFQVQLPTDIWLNFRASADWESFFGGGSCMISQPSESETPLVLIPTRYPPYTHPIHALSVLKLPQSISPHTQLFDYSLKIPLCGHQYQYNCFFFEKKRPFSFIIVNLCSNSFLGVSKLGLTLKMCEKIDLF